MVNISRSHGRISKVMQDSDLARYAPSVFVAEKHASRSAHYTAIPTINVINHMRDIGWNPVQAREVSVRALDRKGYQKHIVRFRQVDPVQVGDTFPEVVLTNAHDGTAAFRFFAGLFRLACMNGLCVDEQSFESIRVRHDAYDAYKVIDVTGKVVESIPEIQSQIQLFKQIELSPDERTAYAQSAKMLRFNENEEVQNSSVLYARRTADTGKDLWSTYQVAQENLVRGGIYVTRKSDTGEVRRSRSREVGSIDGSVKLNQSLWSLTMLMAGIKTGKVDPVELISIGGKN